MGSFTWEPQKWLRSFPLGFPKQKKGPSKPHQDIFEFPCLRTRSIFGPFLPDGSRSPGFVSGRSRSQCDAADRLLHEEQSLRTCAKTHTGETRSWLLFVVFFFVLVAFVWRCRLRPPRCVPLGEPAFLVGFRGNREEHRSHFWGSL